MTIPLFPSLCFFILVLNHIPIFGKKSGEPLSKWRGKQEDYHGKEVETSHLDDGREVIIESLISEKNERRLYDDDGRDVIIESQSPEKDVIRAGWIEDHHGKHVETTHIDEDGKEVNLKFKIPEKNDGEEESFNTPPHLLCSEWIGIATTLAESFHTFIKRRGKDPHEGELIDLVEGLCAGGNPKWDEYGFIGAESGNSRINGPGLPEIEEYKKWGGVKIESSGGGHVIRGGGVMRSRMAMNCLSLFQDYEEEEVFQMWKDYQDDFVMILVMKHKKCDPKKKEDKIYFRKVSKKLVKKWGPKEKKGGPKAKKRKKKRKKKVEL